MSFFDVMYEIDKREDMSACTTTDEYYFSIHDQNYSKNISKEKYLFLYDHYWEIKHNSEFFYFFTLFI